jgi:hypothetical protein
MKYFKKKIKCYQLESDFVDMIVVYHKAKEVFQKTIVSNTFTDSNSHTNITYVMYVCVLKTRCVNHIQ